MMGKNKELFHRGGFIDPELLATLCYLQTAMIFPFGAVFFGLKGHQLHV